MDLQVLSGIAIGTISTIVVGVITNLISNPIGSFLNERSNRFKQHHSERILARYNRIKTFKTDRIEYQLYLTHVLLRIACLVTMGAMLYFYTGVTQAALTGLFGSAVRQPAIQESLTSSQSMGNVFAFMTALAVLAVCKAVIDIEHNLRNFEAFEAETIGLLGEQHRALLELDGRP
jgi:hypothetical protein